MLPGALMRRGQAFETMMLVISVIVALAILNVLMGIINSVQINVQNTAEDMIHDGLKKIVSDGYGFSTPTKVSIKRASRFDLRSIAKNDLPEVDTTGTNTKLCFNLQQIPAAILPGAAACSLSGSGASRVLNGGSVSVGPATQDVSFYFVVCGDSNIGGRGIYRIQIAGNAQSASQDCVIT